MKCQDEGGNEESRGKITLKGLNCDESNLSFENIAESTFSELTSSFIFVIFARSQSRNVEISSF